MTVEKYFGKTNSELYDNWVNYHDEIINGSEWRCHKNAAEWIMNTVDEADPIADLGAGNGEIGHELKENPHYGKGPYIIDAYDMNEKMLGRFITDYYRYKVKHNIYDSPLPEQYKYIVGTGVFTLDHVDAKASKNLADSLTEDGLLFGSMSYSYNGNFLESGGWLEQKDLEVYIISKEYKSIIIDGKQEYHRDIIFKRRKNK